MDSHDRPAHAICRTFPLAPAKSANVMQNHLDTQCACLKIIFGNEYIPTWCRCSSKFYIHDWLTFSSPKNPKTSSSQAHLQGSPLQAVLATEASLRKCRQVVHQLPWWWGSHDPQGGLPSWHAPSGLCELHRRWGNKGHRSWWCHHSWMDQACSLASGHETLPLQAPLAAANTPRTPETSLLDLFWLGALMDQKSRNQ